MASLKLEVAKQKDFKEIAKIYCDEFSKPPYKEPWTNSTALKQLKKYSKFCDIWKLVFDKKIIGFYIMNIHRWYPKLACFGEEAAIKKEYQRKGHATFMQKQILKTYKKKGYKSFYGIVNKKGKFKWLALPSKSNILIEKKL